MVTSPKSNGAPILSIVNVVATRGVRLRSRAMSQPAHQAAERDDASGLAHRRGRRPTVRRCSLKGAAGSRRARSGTVLTQWATRRGLSSWACPANGMPTDEIRLARQAIHEHLVRGEQRGEERGSGFRPGLLERGVQLARRSATAPGRCGRSSSAGRAPARGSSSTGAPVGYCAGPVLLVGRRGRELVGARLFGDVLAIRRRRAELGRDADAIGRVQQPEIREEHRRRPPVAHDVMHREDEPVALRGFPRDERANERALGEVERRLGLALQEIARSRARRASGSRADRSRSGISTENGGRTV